MNDYLPWLLEKYGPRLGTDALAKVLDYKSPHQIRNEISAGTFPIPTAKKGSGRRSPRYADARDVAAHLDATRPIDTKKLEEPKPKAA